MAWRGEGQLAWGHACGAFRGRCLVEYADQLPPAFVSLTPLLQLVNAAANELNSDKQVLLVDACACFL